MTGILITLIGYQFLMLGIGWWASRRNTDSEDFYLGGRKLGPMVAALSASASSSSAWSLLGVSGAAFAWGLPAVWLIPSTVGGFLINWYLIAPRLHTQSRATGALTLTEFIAGPRGDPARRTVMRMGAAVILFSFTFYIAAQFQAAGTTFASVLGIEQSTAILIGAAVVLAYVWLGGFWAASVTDSVQGLLMALTALLLPLLALLAVGGPGELISSFSGAGQDGYQLWTGQASLPAALGFVLGLFGIGLGYPGQPHVVNRFMAIENEKAIKRGRQIAVGWACIIYFGMVLLGWCGRILVENLGDGEQLLFVLATLLLPALLAGIMVSAILSAIMSTADSQLLVAASAVSHDLRDEQSNGAASLVRARWVVLAIGLLAIILAIFFPDRIFNRVLFAWQALAAAFGPLLVVTLWRGPVRPSWRIAALITGFTLTVVLSWTIQSPGDWVERLIPLAVALILAGLGSRRIQQSR
ncbi:MAG: sodium/proline symporter [Xanthomonadales bacterium]|nr:sodium/proline symporter [Gammaproteobacteria bacterium]MBT8053878.1 sodium/proline symporter [Gammaproteobacteria bacterium]NND56009.1 sodium/proline symporter [Xanthomonadales bacterium]NNK52070.1 sodium/proline symporter [Xanthomonadales bacterium]